MWFPKENRRKKRSRHFSHGPVVLMEPVGTIVIRCLPQNLHRKIGSQAAVRFREDVLHVIDHTVLGLELVYVEILKGIMSHCNHDALVS